MRIVVLGGGRVGSAIARDLAADPSFEVTVADVSPSIAARFADAPRIRTAVANLADAGALRGAIADAGLVVGAVPGFMGLATMRTVLEAAKPYVDISFFPEDAFQLDALAREKGVPAVVDCGVAPGCSNLVLGHLVATHERVERFVCYVGGLPVERRLPWEYRAVFSPIDVIEEYLRPARLVRGGQVVTLPALSEIEHLDLPGVGTLEAFNSDGLRTLLREDVPEMAEKTMRYPGHAAKMQLLRDAGFFGYEPVTVQGPGGTTTLRPIDVTAALLFPQWQMQPGDQDTTVMRMEATLVDGDRRSRYVLDMLDRFDAASGTTSMARTTGYTCTAVARLVAAGTWREPGVAAPEQLGRRAECYAAVVADLAARGVVFQERSEPA